jgi:hypothetical protein
MKKLVISLVLAVMAVFSLSADEIIKTRRVTNIRDGRVIIMLTQDAKDPNLYGVIWDNVEKVYGTEEITLEEAYFCGSLTNALKVFNMNRTQLEEKREFLGEEARKDKLFGTYLVQYYYLK